ncbi:MAG: tape measure protein [Rheinheimera sp.]|nr:tape measure protein [Rheinheimera sp.]
MNDLVLALKLTTSGGQLVVKELSSVSAASRNADNAVAGLGESSTTTAGGLDDVRQGSQRLASESRRTASELDVMRGRMLALAGVSAALFGAFQAYHGITALIERADDFNVLQARIRTATAETNDYNQVSAEMYAIAQRNGAALGPTVELFQRLATSRKDLKATNAQMLDFADAVQKLGVIGGSSTSALEAGLLQLSQGLSGGVLRAEEFNSILENIPELASRIGKGMDDIGKSKTDLGLGDLRKLVLEGKLLSEDVLKSILVQMPEIEKQFAKMPLSVGRAGVMLDNSLDSALSRLDESIEATRAWADILASMSKTLDSMSASELQDVAATLAAVGGGAAALLVLSRYNIGLKAIAVAGVSLISSLFAQTAAMMGVAGGATVATRQITLLGVASAATSRALGLLGGPLGIAMVVAGAIYQFAQNSDLGAEKADLLAERLAKLSSAYGDVGKAQLQKAVKENTQELKVNADRILEITNAMSVARDKIEGNPASNAAKQAYKSLGNLKQELAALNAQQVVLLEDSAKLGAMFFDFSKATDPYAQSAALASEELLKLYNAQRLNAEAVDQSGRALNGVNLDLFKSQFKEASTLPKDAEAAIRAFAKTADAAAQLLVNDKYLVSLKEEVRLQQVRLNLGEAEYELQKAISSQKMVEPAQLKLLKDLLAQQRQLTQAKAQTDGLKTLKAENDLLQIRLTKGEHEYQLQKMIRDLKITDPALIQQLDAEIERQRLLNEQLDVRKYLTDGSYDEVLNGLTAIGDAGSSAGNALVEAFGSVADQFARMAEQQDEFTKKFLTLSEARKKAEKETDPAKRTKALQKADAVERSLVDEQTRLQMGNYSTLAGAASQMFGEQSKGRKVLHNLEVTFAAIETALALKKAAANAIAAITNQGSGDPYTAFARIAAMAAIMAGFGVFGGSVSGSGVSSAERQQTQGTGSVLGDSEAKSASIANNFARLEELELDQYAELRAINGSIRELSAGIKNLAISLVANYGKFDETSYSGSLGKEYNVQLGSGFASLVGGGVLGVAIDKLLGGVIGGITNRILGGLFGSKTKELLDSGIKISAQELGDVISSGIVNATVYDVVKTTKKKLWGVVKSSSENTEYRAVDNEIKAEFGRIFSSMGKSISSAVELLGVETGKSLNDFVINIPSISLKGLSGDEIAKELEAVFSQQGDLMVKYLLPGIADFQKMGEGLYETLIRVAQEQAVFNASLDALGLQLSRFAGMTKAVEVEVAQALIELMGGIEQFQSATSAYFSEFYSDAEQQAYLAKMLSAQFASLGVAMPTTREQFKSLVAGLDLTTESGQKMFAALMAMVEGLDQFYDAAEDAKKAAEDAAKAEQALAAKREEYNNDINRQLASFGKSPLENDLAELQQWFIDAKKEAGELGADTSLLTALYGKKREALAEQYITRAIDSAQNAMARLVDDYQRTVEQLSQTLANVLTSISQVVDTIRSDVLNIQKTLPEWNGVSYYKSEVNSLKAKLGTGTATEQLDIVGRLKAAILERYAAEIEGIDKATAAAQAQQEAAQAAYEAQLENVQALRDAAKALKDAGGAMLYSDLSPLTSGERLAALQSQFDSSVNAARGGDAGAYSKVQELGEQLLQLQREFNPATYSSAFNSVLGIFNELGSKTFAEPTAPAPHPAIAAYEAEKIELARKTILELQQLALRTEALSSVANAEYAAAVNSLKAQFSIDSLAIVTAFKTELNAIQKLLPTEFNIVATKLQEQINAITNMRDGVIAAIVSIPQPPIVDLTPITRPVAGLPGKFRDILLPIFVPLPELSEKFLEVSQRVAKSSELQQLQLDRLNQYALKPTPPIIIPPTNVSVSVDMGQVVSNLQQVVRNQQSQIDQMSTATTATLKRLTDVVDTNRKVSTELAEMAAQSHRRIA